MRYDKTITELLPITDYDESEGCFVLKSGGCMDLMQVVCRDLEASDDTQTELLIENFHKCLKIYPGELKLISSNFPTDVKEQISYIRYKIESTKNEIYKHHLQSKLDELLYIQRYRTDREYYLMMFSKSIESFKNDSLQLFKQLNQSGQIEAMDYDKKVKILYKMANKNSPIEVE